MKRLIVLIGFMTVCSGSFADTIVFDSSTSSGFQSGVGNVSWNMTLANGPNEFLAVGCGTRISDTITGITVGGASMTLSTNTKSSSAEATYIFTKASPASGSQSIVVTAGSSIKDRTKCGAVSWTGVAQTSSVDVATGTRNNGGGIQASTMTTTVANDVLFDVVSDGNTAETINPSSGQGQFFLNSTNWTVFGSTKTTTTAGIYGMGWAVVNSPSCQSFISIKPNLSTSIGAQMMKLERYE